MSHKQPSFGSLEEELAYWRDLAGKFNQEKDSVQKEFDDYTADSQQLEKEYEATIEQNERNIRDLRSANNRAQNELESLRTKLEQCNKENANLQSDINKLKNEKIEMANYIRQLEQKNDDLERAERMIAESVVAVEASLNMAIERNAFLESEVDEKECLKEKLQRLADESRDLKQELLVKERCPDNERVLNGHAAPPIDSNRIKVEHETQTTPLKRDPNLNVESPFSPSSRILALNIVGDLLRKVGSLEAKLGHRNGYRESSDSLRNRQSSRGRTSPSNLQGLVKLN